MRKAEAALAARQQSSVSNAHVKSEPMDLDFRDTAASPWRSEGQLILFRKDTGAIADAWPKESLESVTEPGVKPPKLTTHWQPPPMAQSHNARVAYRKGAVRHCRALR